MAKRSWMLLALAALAPGVFAQSGAVAIDLSTARRWMADGIAPLRTTASINIELAGVEWTTSSSIPIAVSLVVEKGRAGTVETSWMEAKVSRNSALTHRIAADSQMLWAYNALRGDYVSGEYNNLQAPRADHLTRMLLLASRWSPRESDFSIRLARDIYLGGTGLAARWTPWIGSVRDAALDQPDSLTARVTYRTASPVQELVYTMTREDESRPWILSQVDYGRSAAPGTGTPSIAWTARIQPEVIPTSTYYPFVPPANSKARATGGL
jgi:hypothetical protein